MGKSVLADSIVDVTHLQAFDLLWEQRLNQIELDQLLVYIIDTVNSAALPYLASQFDVAGEKGYRLAATDADKRRVIKQAIELKRYIGTVWAVKQAMVSVGFGGATLEEGVDEGDPAHDWAKIRVTVDLGNSGGLPDGSGAAELTALINYYKNVRTKLLDVNYTASINDTLPDLTDEMQLAYEAAPIMDSLGWIARFANGTYLADGSVNANEGNDYMTVIIE